MVAGIIMTAGADELTIAHPLDTTTPELTVLILGGPALYLIGNALFNWILSGLLPASRLMAIVALLILLFTAGDVSTLSLMFAATLVLLALVGWDMRDRWRFSG